MPLEDALFKMSANSCYFLLISSSMNSVLEIYLNSTSNAEICIASFFTNLPLASILGQDLIYNYVQKCIIKFTLISKHIHPYFINTE